MQFKNKYKLKQQHKTTKTTDIIKSIETIGMKSCYTYYILIFIFILFSSLSFSSPTVISAEKSKVAGCEFALSLNDWRVIAFFGLIIGIIIIGLMYMYGSVVDESFITRAKNELYQIVFTGLILVFFTFIVSFICSDFISDIFGVEGPTYAAAESYLSDLSSFLGYSVLGIGVFGSGLALLSSVEIKGESYITASNVFKIFSDPLSYITDSIFVLYGIVLGAYVLTITQLHVIKIVPYLSLFFLIPIGLVLRSMFPFRRFGGALLGVGIGLFIFIPLVLLLNYTMINAYIADPIFKQLTCTDDLECYSHTCEFDPNKNIKICKPMKAEGKPCDSDFQCQSGHCRPTPTGKVCMACGTEGALNPICCEGFIRNNETDMCKIAKQNGEKCNEDKECISRLCRKTDSTYSILCINGSCITNEVGESKVCVPKKSNGESCNSHDECASRSCTGIPKTCRATIMTEEDTNYIIVSSYMYANASPSSQFQIFNSQQTVSGVPTSDALLGVAQSSSTTVVSSYVNKIIDLVVVSFIAGILLPLLNLTVISKGVRDLSAALGSEMDIASIWKIL